MIELSGDYMIPADIEAPHEFARGLVPRDYASAPVGSIFGGVAFDLAVPLIPREQWPERIREQEQTGTRLSDIRNRADAGQPMAALDQNGQGYCWAYSTTACLMLARAVANMPYVRLSPHSMACKLKSFRDEGGWCGLSMEWLVKHGVMPESAWPQKSMSRQHDTPANWEIASRFRVAEGWVDLDAPVYGKRLTFDQVASCLLAGIPVAADFNHWAHSVCLMDLVEVDSRLPLTDARRWGVRLLNSWRNDWGQNGTGVLTGQKAVPDGAVAIRSPVFSEG